MFLVALNHEVERQLAYLWARLGPPGSDMCPSDFVRLVQELQAKPKKDLWAELSKLRYDKVNYAEDFVLLRKLANAFKHELDRGVGAGMWKSLKLTEDSDPQSLSRNDAVREALAGRLGLTDQADYLDISELLVQRIYEFVKNVENENANSLQGVMGTSSSINCPFR